MNSNSYFCEMVDQSLVPRLEKARPHPVPLPQERGKLSSDDRDREDGQMAADDWAFCQKRLIRASCPGWRKLALTPSLFLQERGKLSSDDRDREDGQMAAGGWTFCQKRLIRASCLGWRKLALTPSLTPEQHMNRHSLRSLELEQQTKRHSLRSLEPPRKRKLSPDFRRQEPKSD
jgi:hypothetical protein